MTFEPTHLLHTPREEDTWTLVEMVRRVAYGYSVRRANGDTQFCTFKDLVTYEKEDDHGPVPAEQAEEAKGPR